jgi:single-strand DNA-binding protein
MNKAFIFGNLGRDPELRTTAAGKPVCTLSVATTCWNVEKETTEWHNVVVWDKQANYVADRAHKGTKVLVEGRIVTRSYQDKTGTQRQTTEIVASSVVVVDGIKKPVADVAGEPAAPEKKEPLNGSDIPF